jgi:hypothetical protein
MQTPSTQSNHAPEAFIQKHQADVTGILKGFDRLRLQGTLRSLYHPASMEAYLQLAHVLWKDFKTFTTGITARIRAASEGIARAAGRPFRYLPSVNLRKEDEAKKIALADGIDSGLIAVFGCVASENAPRGKKSWRILRRGVADLYRRAEICQAANRRYLDALAALSAGVSLGEEAARVCKPVRKNSQRHRALNPLSAQDSALLAAVNRGEFALNGLRNRDLRILLFGPDPLCPKTRRRQAAAITRKLRLLRAHGLIRKVSHTHRYLVTPQGRRIITALLSALNANVEQLTKMAA